MTDHRFVNCSGCSECCPPERTTYDGSRPSQGAAPPRPSAWKQPTRPKTEFDPLGILIGLFWGSIMLAGLGFVLFLFVRVIFMGAGS